MSPYRRQEECLSRKPGSFLTDTRRERTNYLELFNDHEMAGSRTESNFGDIRGKYLFRHPEYAMLCKYRTNYIYTQHNDRSRYQMIIEQTNEHANTGLYLKEHQIAKKVHVLGSVRLRVARFVGQRRHGARCTVVGENQAAT